MSANRMKVEAALQRLLAYPHAALSSTELATILGISRPGVTQRARRGALPIVDFHLGARPFWKPESVKEWLLDKL